MLPVVISVYKDKSFSFITKKPPAGNLLKKVAGLASGSKEANKIKVGKITKAQLMEVVKIKMPDLNTKDPEAAAAFSPAPPARWASKSKVTEYFRRKLFAE